VQSYSPVLVTTSDKPSQQMALTSSTSKMSLFDRINSNFWKEQMQDYLIVCGQINPIEHDNAPATYKPEKWKRLDWVARATHLSEFMYYTVQSCMTAKELWKTLLDTYEKKLAAMKIYLIRRLYNLRIKESDSIMAHLNDYE
jgi:hypothetical protein